MMNAASSLAALPAQGEAYLSAAELRRQFNEYTSDKDPEIQEQKQARRYYHMDQWTAEELKELEARKQPPTTTPIFARKVNGFVGLVERLRADPKAFPRTERHEQGAELATAVLRYALDRCQWQAITPEVARYAAIDGIAGIEIKLEPGDSGQPDDYDIVIDQVEPDTFFYDPRSFRPDFSDARYMGVSKWLDEDAAKEMFPDKADQIAALISDGDEFAIDSDRDKKWSNSDLRQIRIVEHWYRRGGKWMYCFYSGGTMLMQGRSYLQDEKGRDICRFVMFSSFVDHDGDRYSFHRNFKPLIDELNRRNSKALHLLNMRRIKALKGAVDDIEVLRREATRPDGVILYNMPDAPPEFDDARTLADMQGQLAFLERNRNEVENYGPNPALIGQGVDNKSGRAIQLMQQAGIAELGPYILGLRGWKIRVYRAIWNAIRQHWKAERWIRVTDSEDKLEGFPVNKQAMDPATGMTQLVNALGSLDVDIIIDEGPDTVTMAADALETLQSAMSSGAQIPPKMLIRLLPVQDSVKKQMLADLEQAAQPSPVQEQATMLELAGAEAKVKETEASAVYKQAQAQKTMIEAQMAPIEMEQKIANDQLRAFDMGQRQAQPAQAAF